MGKRTNTAVWMGKQNRWQIKVQKDGERKTFTSSKPGRVGQREANAKADAWLDEGITDTSARISALYESWFEQLQITTSRSNWYPVQTRWKNHILPAIGNRKISAINEQMLQDAINAAYAKGLSKKYLTSMCADMRAFFKYCRKRKVTSFIPEDLKPPAGARSKGKNILQPSDLIKLFNSDNTFLRGKECFDEYVNAYRFEILTGMRPGEIIGLCWSDIKGRTVFVKRAINRFGEETQGKNENAVRSFKMSDMAYRAIQDQRALTGGQGSVFNIVSTAGYYGRWKKYCAHNEITPISLYEMRHTFVSIVKNLPAGQVKPIVGHSEDMDTFGIYGHELNGDDDAVAKEVGILFDRLIHPTKNENKA